MPFSWAPLIVADAGTVRGQNVRVIVAEQRATKLRNRARREPACLAFGDFGVELGLVPEVTYRVLSIATSSCGSPFQPPAKLDFWICRRLSPETPVVAERRRSGCRCRVLSEAWALRHLLMLMLTVVPSLTVVVAAAGWRPGGFESRCWIGGVLARCQVCIS